MLCAVAGHRAGEQRGVVSVMRILLVEDDEDTAAYVIKGLREVGQSVERARDGRDGLFRATGEDFGLIILDRMMPGLDGLSLM